MLDDVMTAQTANTLGELVLHSHESGSSDLMIALPPESLHSPQESSDEIQIDGNSVVFASIEGRNRFLASYLFDKHKAQFQLDPSQWLHKANDVWRHEIGSSDRVAGRLLALAHNTEDILLVAASAIVDGSIEVFTVLHVVEAALPYFLRIEPASIIQLCDVQHEKTKNDLMAGAFLSQLQKKLSNMPESCRLLHSLLQEKISQSTVALHPTTLLALASQNAEESLRLAIEDTKSENVILRRAAIWTLGRLLVCNLIKKTEFASAVEIITLNISHADEQVRRTAIYAAAESVSITRKFDPLLLKMAKTGEQEVLAALSHHLFMNTKDLADKDIFKKYIRQLCKLTPTFKGAVDNFDFILAHLLADKVQQQFVLSCLSEWVARNGHEIPRDTSFPELFDSTVFELLKRPELLSQIITEWLSSDDRKHAAAVAGLLSKLWVHGFKNPEFDTTLLSTFNKADFLFLVRRLLGFVNSEDHLLSLTISLLKSTNLQDWKLGFVHTVLAEEVGMDYPDSTMKRLEQEKSQTSDPKIVELYSRVIHQITSHIDAIEALPRIEELKPPPDVQRLFASAHSKQMNVVAKEARKKSIVSQIFTEIPMKGGSGWFSFRDGGYTEASNLIPHSHSIALPRRHVLDAVGYEIRHMGFRLARRGVE
ncbi:hypothetical protein FY034_04755 [Trichlorobacter lovleyi]|uniref:HEAT repeat domain-containing protein n=1 Tax=Trichlorobacter lovleyi TaxID=313985 RepID=UPI00223EE94C|nr:hypothetical protein [Trichlorobacter lovleyi]QOX78270.1 hypothetical protein FY034_04755 [Trichlorobacter lovleyi]